MSLAWTRDKRQWRTSAGVIFTAYRVADLWVGARQAPGEPEELLRSYPSWDDVEQLFNREQPQQRQLL